jgi:hypothetical protein
VTIFSSQIHFIDSDINYVKSQEGIIHTLLYPYKFIGGKLILFSKLLFVNIYCDIYIPVSPMDH